MIRNGKIDIKNAAQMQKILDEVKKIMSKEDWNACVARAKAKLEQNFIECDLIDPEDI